MTEKKLQHLKRFFIRADEIELSIKQSQGSGVVSANLDDEAFEFVKNAVIEAIDKTR